MTWYAPAPSANSAPPRSTSIGRGCLAHLHRAGRLAVLHVEASIVTGPCVTLRFFSDERGLVERAPCRSASPIGVFAVSTMTMSPPSSLISVEVAIGIVWPLTAMRHAVVPAEPAASGDGGLRDADAAASTVFCSATVFGSTVISFSRVRHLGRHRLLEPPAEVLGQELLGRGEHRHVVHRAREAVALVGRHEVLDREAAVAQRDDDLVGLGLASRAGRWRPARRAAAS